MRRRIQVSDELAGARIRAPVGAASCAVPLSEDTRVEAGHGQTITRAAVGASSRKLGFHDFDFQVWPHPGHDGSAPHI